jgi:hypothetical protein
VPAAVTFVAGASAVSFPLAAAVDAEVEPTELLRVEVVEASGQLVPEPLVVALRDAGGAASGGCVASSPACLQGGRFEVEAEWIDPTTGLSQRGRVRELGIQNPPVGGAGATDTTTAVSFFNPENIEVIVKVVDGSSINGHFWTFFGKVSDLEVFVLITDHHSGSVRVWRAPPGELCGEADIESFPAVGLSEDAEGAENSEHAEHAQMLGSPGDAPFAEHLSPFPASVAECPADALCFIDRFEARVSWAAGGDAGDGIPLSGTAETGYFWFFEPSNVEVAVKVLDGRAINGRFWVFAGSLTDLAYDLAVFDRATGEQRLYQHAAGDLCGFADTSAFE